jgi:hypothetical protein
LEPAIRSEGVRETGDLLPASKSLWLGFTPVSRGGAGQRTGCDAAMPVKGLARWLVFRYRNPWCRRSCEYSASGCRTSKCSTPLFSAAPTARPKSSRKSKTLIPPFCCTLPEARGLIRSRSHTMGLARGTPDGPCARFSLRECIATAFPGLQRDVWEGRSSGGPPILSLPIRAPPRWI